MDLSAALRAGPALLRRRPAGVLPYYLLVASVPTVARVPVILGAGAAAAWLATTGRLAPVVARVRELDLGSSGETGGVEGGIGGGEGGPGSALSPELLDALSGLVTPTTVALVGGGLAATLVIAVAARAVTGAGALTAVERALAGADPLPAGVRGMGRHWRTFLWLTLARIGAWTAGVVVLVIASAGGEVGIDAGGAIRSLALLLAAAVWLVVFFGLIAVELGVAFAGAAVVVDGVGARAALRRGVGVVRNRLGAALLYLGVVVGVFGGMGTAGVVLAAAGVPRVLGLVAALVAFPALDAVRVALYAERGPDALPDPDKGGIERLVTAGRAGLAELRTFVVRHPTANAGSAGLLAVGGALGWLLVAPYGLAVSPPGDATAAFGAVPVGPFVNIAANNWLVAAGAGYGGLALGAPAATALLLNGALVGGVAGVVETTTFLAFIAPHGVIELPAIAVAGGLGLHLGWVGLAALRGRRDAAAVGEDLGGALRVLVGLAVLFVLAAAIEAFVTPRVAAAVLG